MLAKSITPSAAAVALSTNTRVSVALKVEEFSSNPSDGVAGNLRYSVGLDCPLFPSPDLMTSLRTYNIARRNVWAGQSLLATYFIVVVVCCHRF